MSKDYLAHRTGGNVRVSVPTQSFQNYNKPLPAHKKIPSDEKIHRKVSLAKRTYSPEKQKGSSPKFYQIRDGVDDDLGSSPESFSSGSDSGSFTTQYFVKKDKSRGDDLKSSSGSAIESNFTNIDNRFDNKSTIVKPGETEKKHHPVVKIVSALSTLIAGGSKDSVVYGPPNRSMALRAIDKSATYGSMALGKIWDVIRVPVLDDNPVRNRELWAEIREEQAAKWDEALYAAIDRENARENAHKASENS
jgi:hypothetical protein